MKHFFSANHNTQIQHLKQYKSIQFQPIKIGQGLGSIRFLNNTISSPKKNRKLTISQKLVVCKKLNKLDVVWKCANISSISERIKQLAKSWYKKAIINNSDIKEYITTAEASLDTPLA